MSTLHKQHALFRMSGIASKEVSEWDERWVILKGTFRVFFFPFLFLFCLFWNFFSVVFFFFLCVFCFVFLEFIAGLTDEHIFPSVLSGTARFLYLELSCDVFSLLVTY